MALIRQATAEDIAQLSEFGSKFFQYSGYGKLLPYSAEGMVHALYTILDTGVIFVAEVDGRLVGTIMGIISAMWCQPSVPVAAELAWWVDEEHRNGPVGIRLLKQFEDHAKEQGAQVIAMSDLLLGGKSMVAEMLNRLGYETTERTHMKVL